jgi:hypothetical protein
LPMALQIIRSTAWMLPTKARPVAMPTPTERFADTPSLDYSRRLS